VLCIHYKLVDYTIKIKFIVLLNPIALGSELYTSHIEITIPGKHKISELCYTIQMSNIGTSKHHQIITK